MSLLDQVRKLEQQVSGRLKELEPLTREYEQLRNVAERLGLKYTPTDTDTDTDQPPAATRRGAAKARAKPRAVRRAAKAKAARSSGKSAAKRATTPRAATTRGGRGARAEQPATGGRATATPASQGAATGGRRSRAGRSAARPGEREAQVLRIVGESPGITVREIGERLGVDPTGLYRVTKKLTAEGRLRKDGPRLHATASDASAPTQAQAASATAGVSAGGNDAAAPATGEDAATATPDPARRHPPQARDRTDPRPPRPCGARSPIRRRSRPRPRHRRPARLAAKNVRADDRPLRPSARPRGGIAAGASAHAIRAAARPDGGVAVHPLSWARHANPVPTAERSAVAPRRWPVTTATSSNSRSRRSPAASAAPRPRSRPTSMTRPARRPRRSRRSIAATAARAAPTPAPATARATPTCTAGAATPAWQPRDGHAHACARRCAAGPSSTVRRRRLTTGPSRTHAAEEWKRCAASKVVAGRRRQPSPLATGRGPWLSPMRSSNQRRPGDRRANRRRAGPARGSSQSGDATRRHRAYGREMSGDGTPGPARLAFRDVTIVFLLLNEIRQRIVARVVSA